MYLINYVYWHFPFKRLLIILLIILFYLLFYYTAAICCVFYYLLSNYLLAFLFEMTLLYLLIFID